MRSQLTLSALLPAVGLFVGIVSADDGTVYKACSLPKYPLPIGAEYPAGINQPLRQNGTYIDVGVWENREDLKDAPPFLFTLGPGHNASTHTIIKNGTDEKLAYEEDDSDLCINSGFNAAFFLTTKGNTDKHLVDSWTVTKDSTGSMVLGLAPPAGTVFGGGSVWTVGTCAWFKDGLCDGSYFMNRLGGFGIQAVIAVEEWTG